MSPSVGKLLAGCWQGVGKLLASCWQAVGKLLAGCWQGVGKVLAGCWQAVGKLLASCWQNRRAIYYQHIAAFADEQSRFHRDIEDAQMVA